jgi:hypothetical protein
MRSFVDFGGFAIEATDKLPKWHHLQIAVSVCTAGRTEGGVDD